MPANSKPRPRLVVAFEGGEAAGKTTQIARLALALQDRGLLCLSSGVFRTEHGRLVRSWLMDQKSQSAASLSTQVFVLASAMCQTLEEISASDAAVVLLDRYVYTTMAYHGGGLEMGIEAVEEIYSPVIRRGLPDLVILLDLPPSQIRARRSPGDWVEARDLPFHERVRAAYRDLSTRYPGFQILDATLPPDELAGRIVNLVQLALRDRSSFRDQA